MKRSEATGDLIVIRQASVMEALRRIGWKEELTRGLGMAADVIWYCGVQDPDDITFLHRRAGQQINRIPRMQGIVSKNSFAEAMMAASSRGEVAHFHPPSACITSRDSAAAQLEQLLTCPAVGMKVLHTAAKDAVGTGEVADDKPLWFIVKSDIGRCGDGIQIIAADDVKRLTEVTISMAPCVLQRYVVAPLLFQRHKFDLRLYVLVLCLEDAPSGFRAFLFHDGLARLCSEEYQAPTAANCRRTFMHLTNFSINKSNGVAVQLKLKARTVLQRVQDALELPSLWPYAVGCCASTVRALLPQHIADLKACSFRLQGLFHLLGVDVMFELKTGNTPICHMLEVNVNPSMSCESDADREVKLQLLVDSLKAASSPSQCPATFEQLV